MTLRIAQDFALGDDYVTKTAAIVAQRRKGKTYLANVIAEELVTAGLPWVAIDPTGAWWGLRASANGKREGLPVVVLGGSHGDAPLDRTSGRVVAELVVEHPGWYVLDMSLFESKNAERDFAADFAEALYRLKGHPGRDFPLHLFVDEADMFVPQDKESGDQRMLGAFQSIVRRGGLRGLGTTIISQRPALVNKSVLVQLDILIVLRLVAGNDQDYVKKNYFERAGTKEQVADLMASMARLNLGEAWFWEPGEDVFERIQVRERYTFNSSVTPKPGETRIEPSRLAEVDLEAVKKVMSETIEKAKADDPRELRKQVADLKQELYAARQAPTKPPEPLEVEVNVITPVAAESLKDVLARMESVGDLLSGHIETLVNVGDAVTTALAEARVGEKGVRTSKPKSGGFVAPKEMNLAYDLTAVGSTITRTPIPSTEKLGKGEKMVLAVLAQYPAGRTHDELAFLAGYSAKASTTGVILGKLRRMDLVEQGQPIKLTQDGYEVAGPVEILTGQALLDKWMRHPKMGRGEKEALHALVNAYPDSMTHEELCAATGYSPDASTIGVILGKLRKLGLVQKGARRMLDEFMESIA